MKNLQRGFVIPLIIAIVALLGIGGGAYIYVNSKHTKTDTSLKNDLIWSPDLGSVFWADANKTCSNLGTGWRLPSEGELILALRKQFDNKKFNETNIFKSNTAYWYGDSKDILGKKTSLERFTESRSPRKWNEVSIRCVNELGTKEENIPATWPIKLSDDITTNTCDDIGHNIDADKYNSAIKNYTIDNIPNRSELALMGLIKDGKFLTISEAIENCKK